MNWGTLLSDPEAVGPLIPVVLIVTGGIVAIVVAIAKLAVAHRERMAMIEQGLHPDHPAEEVDAVGRPDEIKQTQPYQPPKAATSP